jgi:hypothetical protein
LPSSARNDTAAANARGRSRASRFRIEVTTRIASTGRIIAVAAQACQSIGRRHLDALDDEHPQRRLLLLQAKPELFLERRRKRRTRSIGGRRVGRRSRPL